MKLERETLRFLWFYRYFWFISIFRNRDGITKINCLPYNFRKWALIDITSCCETICEKDNEIQWGMSPWWRHQMKTFPRYWPFVWGIHRSPMNSPHKGKWRGALIFSLICAWIDGWVNNREAVDVIRHRAHYDVTVRAPMPASHRGYYPGTPSRS